ncbi:VCBS repeat-containing protein [Nocardioides sp.]|uniref:FG-GAP repeat domain-containing protein n=1 Tax=Nocardioides sp. TaxID=35761 RepID=UPI002B2797E5|nr:VCBS repeat-containing protein [Nocardioides sp.]
MSSEHRDPIFDTLDQLAGLADGDVAGDRMPDIRRRVRATRRKRMAGVGVAAAAVVAAGLGLSQLLPEAAEIDPAPPVGDLGQNVTITAEAPYSDQLRIQVAVEGRSTAYTGADGESVAAGPLSLEVVVDGEVVDESPAAEVSCEPGGEVSTYSVTYPESSRRSVVAPVSGPGKHVVEVRAPYCADGELVDEVTRTTVTSRVGEPVVQAESVADVDGDGRPDTVQVVSPAVGEQGDWILVAQLADGAILSEPLPDTSEWGLPEPRDLDGDGTAEIVVIGGGGESWSAAIYQVDGAGLRLVPTLNESGQDEPLAYGVSEGTPQNVTFQIQLIDEGFMSFRFLDAAPTRPAAVDVRRWVLADGTLTLQDATEPGCVDADFQLTFGAC